MAIERIARPEFMGFLCETMTNRPYQRREVPFLRKLKLCKSGVKPTLSHQLIVPALF